MQIIPSNQETFDVIFGLAFNSISIKGAISPFTNIKKSEIFKENKISFYLKQDNKENGEIIFGSEIKIRWNGILFYQNLFG